MRRSSSSSAEEVETEEEVEAALVHGLVVGVENLSVGIDAALELFILSFIFLKTAFNLEVLTRVCVLEEVAELIVFLGMEGFCGSIAEVSAMVCES